MLHNASAVHFEASAHQFKRLHKSQGVTLAVTLGNGGIPPFFDEGHRVTHLRPKGAGGDSATLVVQPLKAQTDLNRKEKSCAYAGRLRWSEARLQWATSSPFWL